MTSNPQLQSRAGKNYYPIFGLIQGVAAEAFKLEQNNLIVMEGDNNLLAGGSSFSASNDFLNILNNTGVALDFSLIFVDPEGSELVIQTKNIADGVFDDLGSFTQFVLPEGCKLKLQTSGGSVTAGGGVHVLRNITKPTLDSFKVVRAERVTTTEFVFEAPAGAWIGVVPSFANFGAAGPGDVSVSSRIVWPDGTEHAFGGSTAVGGTIEDTPLAVLSQDIKLKLVLSGLPPTGYLYMFVQHQLASNAFNAEPAV